MSDIEGAIRDAIVDEHVVIDVSAVTSVDVTGAMALVKALRGVAKDGVVITIQSGGRRLDPALRFFLDECRADGLEIAEHHDRTSRPVFSSRPPAPQGGSAMHVANL